MRHKRLHRQGRPGVLLVEVLLGISVFVLFSGTIILTLIRGEEGTAAGGDRIRGAQYAEEALDVARAIRDRGFSSLTAGTHGFTIDGSGKWAFSGTETAVGSGYTVSVTITPYDEHEVLATATCSWNRAPNRTQTVTLQTIIAALTSNVPVGKWSALTLTGSYVYPTNPGFTDVAVAGTYAFVGSATAAQSLFVFNVSNPQSIPPPTVVNMGAAVRAVEIRGNTLYVLTDAAASELRAYSIQTPISPGLLAAYDLPGNGQVAALALKGDFLFVGGTGLPPMAGRYILPGSPLTANVSLVGSVSFCISETGALIQCALSSSADSLGWLGESSSSSNSSYNDLCPSDPCQGGGGVCSPSACTYSPNPPCYQCGGLPPASSSASASSAPTGNDFFSFDISDRTQLLYLDSIYVGGVKDITVVGNSAYVAGTPDDAELRVVNVANPGILAFGVGSVNGAPPGGYNLNDRTADGLSVFPAGNDAVLLGTAAQTGVNSIVLFDTPTHVLPPSTPAPWLMNGSGSAVRVSGDPGGCYAFAATNWFPWSLQVYKIKDRSLTRLQTYTPVPSYVGAATGLIHDPARDRLYLTTSQALYVFRPGAPPSDCP